MNCPKCGWPGLIAGHLKRRLAELEDGSRRRMEDNAHLRSELHALKFLIEFSLKRSDAELREVLALYLKHGWPGGEAWVPPAKAAQP